MFLSRIMPNLTRSDKNEILVSSGDTNGYPDGRSTKRQRSKPFRAEPAFRALKHPQVKLLDASASIDDDAAQQLGITESERIIMQEVIQEHFGRLRTLMAPTITTSESDEKTYLFIPALQDRGDHEIESFQNDMAAILREERTKKALLMLPVDEYYGGFGQFDVSITVTSRFNQKSSTGPKKDLLLVEYSDPVTGKVMVRRSTTWEKLESWFPKLFEMTPE